MRPTPHPRGRSHQQTDLPDTSDTDKDTRNTGASGTPSTSSPKPKRNLAQTLAQIHTPENHNKTIVPETPIQWNDIMDQEMTDSQKVQETPMQTRSKSSTRLDHD